MIKRDASVLMVIDIQTKLAPSIENADAVIASGATSRLAGIVLLDGAPPGDVLPVALDKLEGLGAYIPVLELGAPRDSGPRRVDEALNGHRPGHFNGLVKTMFTLVPFIAVDSMHAIYSMLVDRTRRWPSTSSG